MKKLLISLLIGVSLFSVGCGGGKEDNKLSPYEINSITSLRDTITDIDSWYLYYSDSEIIIGDFNKNKDIIKKGTIFNWSSLSLDEVTKNDKGLFEGDGIVEFDYRKMVFTNLDQLISDEFIVNEKVNSDDCFLGVYEIEKVTNDTVYLNVKKIVLAKYYMDLNNKICLVEVY